MPPERGKNIRNFCIIAHIDHGKSTLADRLLEITGTVPRRKMREQVLDSMELERERGITIKMTPVRMMWKPDRAQFTQHFETPRACLTSTNSRLALVERGPSERSESNSLPQGVTPRGQSAGFPNNPHCSDTQTENNEYILNLIDTPGHIDFAYEVSRALRAVEGAVLLVDATQGVQAQTLTTFQMARDAGLALIPAVNKIDAPLARVPETRRELAQILSCPERAILEVSGKTGQGVPDLLAAIIERIPSPQSARNGALHALTDAGRIPQRGAFRALVFDFQYSNHTGVIVFIRILEGEAKRGDELKLAAGGRTFKPVEAGVFTPEPAPASALTAGEIGYFVTGIKEPGIARVGDTITGAAHPLPALPGYERPKPVVFAGVYPDSQDGFNHLRRALERLRLSDASFTHEEESSGILGRGFRCGFLGMLHLEIVTERLRREFGLSLVVTAPSITYEVADRRGRRETVYSAARFPEYGEIAEVYEPWTEVRIITPQEYLSALMPLLYAHEAAVATTENFGDRTVLVLEMPLRELMRGFFDEVKSFSSGFASFSYRLLSLRRADVVKLELLVAGEVVPAFSRIVSRRRVETEAELAVEKLHRLLPRQLFAAKIQGRALGRVISSRTLRALAKDVTGYLYGGDRTRKMKLWQQQKEGKKRLKEEGSGRVRIPPEVFVKMVQP